MDIEQELTEVFRKVIGSCPIADCSATTPEVVGVDRYELERSERIAAMRKTNGKLRSERKKGQYEALAMAGMSAPEIAGILGISPQAVYVTAAAYGLKLPRHNAVNRKRRNGA